MKKNRTVIIGLLLIGIIAAFFIWNKFKPPVQHVTMNPAPPSQPYGYDVPVQAESPWPTFRRDRRNTGSSPLPAIYNNDKPWFFQTGKGLFTTPVIDENGMIYVGSADHYFYALNSDGSLNWKYETGEIIDSAGALTPGAITFISGDGHMYHFRTGQMELSARPIWTYEAQLRPDVSYNRWFEGNVAVGYDGTLYSGNTNFLYYAINPDGTLKWTYPTTSNNWSQAAFADDGTIFWGSNDTYIRAVAPDGKEIWKDMTLGFIAASAAVSSDGTVYIGSFDSNLYALDPQTGSVQWKFPTSDHIYTSAALESDASGKTTAILFGSADGTFYSVNPNGKLIWKYDTGDPIRSSPALGLTSDGKSKIVYFGDGNGKLYALNAADGSLRWAYDTTSKAAIPCMRKRLNGGSKNRVSLGKS
jgi:outer membrane protein assembly factor BamB